MTQIVTKRKRNFHTTTHSYDVVHGKWLNIATGELSDDIPLHGKVSLSDFNTFTTNNLRVSGCAGSRTNG